MAQIVAVCHTWIFEIPPLTCSNVLQTRELGRFLGATSEAPLRQGRKCTLSYISNVDFRAGAAARWELILWIFAVIALIAAFDSCSWELV